MEILLESLVLLLVLTGVFTVLGLGCALAERLGPPVEARARRGRFQGGRTQRRQRPPRPRRRREGVDAGADAPAPVPAGGLGC